MARKTSGMEGETNYDDIYLWDRGKKVEDRQK